MDQVFIAPESFQTPTEKGTYLYETSIGTWGLFSLPLELVYPSNFPADVIRWVGPLEPSSLYGTAKNQTSLPICNEALLT